MQKYTANKDLYTVYMMIQNLVPYIYEDELFRLTSRNLPRLTVGGILLRLKRLNVTRELLNELQQSQLDILMKEFSQMREAWKTHYRDKVERELRVRMQIINTFIENYQEDPESSAADYLTVANQRTIIYYLQQEAENLGIWTDAFASQLTQIDKDLQIILDESYGDFIWSENLQDAYPRDIFWWLYAMPVVMIHPQR